MERWQDTEDGDEKLVREVLYRSGLDVDDIYVLVNRRGGSSYREAVPALIQILPTLKNNRIKEGVVRALGVKEASAAGVALIEEFQSLGAAEDYRNRFEFHLHWAIANSIAEVADDSTFDQISILIRDRRYGRAREMLAYALAKVKSRRGETIAILMEALEDDVVRAHAIDALGKMNAIEALSKIRPFVDPSYRVLVRREARKAIKRLEAAKVKNTTKTKKRPTKTASDKSRGKKLLLAPDSETSINTDDSDVKPLMGYLAKSVEQGFSDREIEALEEAILLMEVDDEMDFDYEVIYQGVLMSLRISVHMDDVDSPDLYFYAPGELIKAIDRAIGEQFSEFQEPAER